VSDRRPYWKQRYETKRAAGLCVKGACTSPAVNGQTLCEYHRSQHVPMQRDMQRRKILEERNRERLPDERAGVTIKFTILAAGKMNEKTGVSEVEEVKGYFQTGEYDDGRIGEVFVKIGKPGEGMALFDQWGIAASIALQYGAGVEELFSKHVATRFQPAGKVLDSKGETIDTCTSVLDYVSRWIIKRYANRPRRTP